MFVQTQNWRELRVVLHKPSFEEEGATGSQRWFGSTRGSTNPLWSHLSFYMMDHLGLCSVLVGDLEYERVVLERSSPHLFLYMFLFNKETKYATNKGSTSLDTREPKTSLLLLFIIIYLLCLFLFVHKSFYSSKAKVKLPCISSLDYLHFKLPPMFMKVITQSSLIKIKHHV